jgi:hypothetical protein
VVVPCYIPPTGYARQVGEHCATVAVYLRFGTGHEAPDNPSEVSVKGVRQLSLDLGECHKPTPAVTLGAPKEGFAWRMLAMHACRPGVSSVDLLALRP